MQMTDWVIFSRKNKALSPGNCRPPLSVAFVSFPFTATPLRPKMKRIRAAR
jgi:hypothetical protein